MATENNNQNQTAAQTATVENNVNNNGAQQAQKPEAQTQASAAPVNNTEAPAPQQKPSMSQRAGKAWNDTCKFVQENPAGAVAIAAGGAAAGVGLCKALAAIGRWWRN